MVTSPLRLTAPVPVVNVELPWIVIFPAKVAPKSEARVKIVSSIEFNELPELPEALADLNTIEPPAPVPLPAPPCNTKLPPPMSFVEPLVVEPPLMVRELPAAL